MDGNWFGIDDAFTGPVDELAVLGGLALLAWMGCQWAANTQQQLTDALSAAWSSFTGLFQSGTRGSKEIKRQIAGQLTPLAAHLALLAGRGGSSHGNPKDPRNRKDWTNHAKKAWNNILKGLERLNKPFDQVLRELGWKEEAIRQFINEMIKLGIIDKTTKMVTSK